MEEADLLLNAGHHARALFLAQIAGEEIGKACLLAGYAFLLLRGQADWKRFWKSFRSHSHKLQSVMLTEAMLCPTLSKTERQEELASLKERAKDLEFGKMWSLYVDHIEGAFRQPQSLIPAEMARNAVTWARGRLAMAAQIREIYASKAPEDWTPEQISQIEACPKASR